MTHYLFEEMISGEAFIVGADCMGEAALIAEGIAEDIGKEENDDGEWYLRFLDELTEEEAEMSGLDEY